MPVVCINYPKHVLIIRMKQGGLEDAQQKFHQIMRTASQSYVSNLRIFFWQTMLARILRSYGHSYTTLTDQ